MPTMYFGTPWDAPALDDPDAVQLPIPDYARCTRCRELFAVGDQGYVIPHVGELDPDYLVGVGDGFTLAGTHRECFLAGIVGHTVGVCRCTGWDPDARATGREVQRRIAAGALG